MKQWRDKFHWRKVNLPLVNQIIKHIEKKLFPLERIKNVVKSHKDIWLSIIKEMAHHTPRTHVIKFFSFIIGDVFDAFDITYSLSRDG